MKRPGEMTLDLWIVLGSTLMAISLVQAFLLGMQTWECRRFVRKRLQRVPDSQTARRVALLAPCKGRDVGLRENLQALLSQDYPHYEVTFIVGDAADPAADVIRELLAGPRDVPARLLVAGHADECGQKVHNLRAATARLPADAEVLAFVDSDARPRPDWLRNLVERLDRPGVGAATGYRWFVPARPSLANWLLYALNGTTAGLLGPRMQHLVWGGSWAIRREAFEVARIRDAWQGTLSDDLVATRALRHAGLRVEFEPSCVVASPLDGDWRQTLGFLRRQYLIGRFYLRRWWAIALVWSTLSQLNFWLGAAMAGIAAALGATGWGVPAVLAVAWYATYVIRGSYRRDLARLYLREIGPATAAAIWFDMLAGPLAAAINWVVFAGSMVGRRIHWRGISYEMTEGGRSRLTKATSAPQPRAAA